MKVRLLTVLATLLMLAWASPAQARMARVCSVHQPAKVQLACGKANEQHSIAMLTFVKMHPYAGTQHDRAILKRDARWLRRYATKHISLAKQRMRPSTPACTSELLGLEGGWDPHATNPTTGAYGGPQALPASKMSSAGADWRTNIWTQIRWMIGYVNGRYGGMCNALAFRRANGYY